MRYLRTGSGRALFCCMACSATHFPGVTPCPPLARHSTVHAVDMLGVGFSDRPLGLNAHLRANAERLLRFLDAVNVDSCDLLGTSHGGAVAMMTAALAPERIRQLVLVAPVNPWSHRGRRMAAFLSNRSIAPTFLRVAPHLQVHMAISCAASMAIAAEFDAELWLVTPLPLPFPAPLSTV